jgi:hypothetical protein
MIMPMFWAEDSQDDDGCLTLYYHSQRGNWLAPVGKGLVTEVARFQFELDITMDELTLQGVDGAEFTR